MILGIGAEEKEYAKLIVESSLITDEIKNILSDLGFEMNQIKTKAFEIGTKYESGYDKNKNWKRTFVGYQFTHVIYVDFDKDNTLLGNILNRISKCKSKPEIEIQYKVKNTEEALNKLLQNAINDSKNKAKVLADAAGIMLGDIQNIDYSWGEMKMISTVIDDLDYADMEDDCSMQEDSFSINIEPDDVKLTESVTVLWEIM